MLEDLKEDLKEKLKDKTLDELLELLILGLKYEKLKELKNKDNGKLVG